jgi:hypothetical protein
MDLKDMFADESICVRKADKELFVPLAGEEREAAVTDLTGAIKRRSDLQDRKKSLDTSLSDQIKTEDGYIVNIGEKLREGVLRKIECKEFFFWKAGKVYTIRMDTGEIIGERAVTPEDAQTKSTDIEVPTREIPEDFKTKILALEDKTEKTGAEETDVEIIENITSGGEAVETSDQAEQSGGNGDDGPVDQNYKSADEPKEKAA